MFSNACRCGGALHCRDPNHASNVWNGEIFCSFECMATAQSVAKATELGIPYQRDLFHRPRLTDYG